MRSWLYLIGGIATLLLGIFLAVYVGLWVMFVGGIVQIVGSITAVPINALGIAVGLLRVLGTGVAAGLSWALCAVVAVSLIKKA